MARKMQYHLWVLSATVFIAATLVGGLRFVVVKEVQVGSLQLFFAPILLAELILMSVFYVVRERNCAMSRYIAILVIGLSAVVASMSTAALLILAAS
jgi:hypothetical protein